MILPLQPLQQHSKLYYAIRDGCGLLRCRWPLAASGPAGLTTAPQVVRLDHVKSLQMVRPAAAGSPNEISTISFPVSTSSTP